MKTIRGTDPVAQVWKRILYIHYFDGGLEKHNAPVDLGMFNMFSESKLFVSYTSFSAIAWGISHKEVGAEMATMPWLPCLGNGNTKNGCIHFVSLGERLFNIYPVVI